MKQDIAEYVLRCQCVSRLRKSTSYLGGFAAVRHSRVEVGAYHHGLHDRVAQDSTGAQCDLGDS